ncbi:hypothetical protein BGZ89_001346 [Linnemannia elongata]|nr:hypothetical protein BGZ89_001346 [Linnemannia elongata]
MKFAASFITIESSVLLSQPKVEPTPTLSAAKAMVLSSSQTARFVLTLSPICVVKPVCLRAAGNLTEPFADGAELDIKGSTLDEFNCAPQVGGPASGVISMRVRLDLKPMFPTRSYFC